MEKCYSNYFGLIFKCPVESELNKCVYKKLRRLPSKEKITYYNALTGDEKKALIEKHQYCLAVREKKSSFYKLY
jgi:hypothetical protein